MIHAVNDPQRMRDDAVRCHPAQIIRGQTFENLVREAVRRGERELECLRVSEADASEVGRLHAAFLGQRGDLRRGTVDDEHADVQRAQHREIEQDVREVFVRDDRAINGDDERLFAEAWNVLEDSPEVGRFHLAKNHRAHFEDAAPLDSTGK